MFSKLCCKIICI